MKPQTLPFPILISAILFSCSDNNNDTFQGKWQFYNVEGYIGSDPIGNHSYEFVGNDYFIHEAGTNNVFPGTYHYNGDTLYMHNGLNGMTYTRVYSFPDPDTLKLRFLEPNYSPDSITYIYYRL